ncbi:META domain-containing protein [Maridesulfovibrio hydrothermalis]|uniref:DUF306 domain-containing protein n=1 Tax=Maridesulfovibrio hydrothermalis AM13 = DSM 14728 TaxID=1121451 RepID=L0R9M8_9BACT|nr:META domain-containing protein [Maridesulfovibrio hydrothermalis]CCO23478.1 conserved exported protein of unknown function [Maridesulfovibrio hydrothermalis AM13 = DSM 14728]
MKNKPAYKHFLLTAAAILILFSAGCATHSAGPYNTSAMNTKWLLEDINGMGLIDFAHIWLRFDDDSKIYGSGGCNSFRGHYTYENGEFKTGPLAMTRKACPSAIDTQEFKFMQALENVRTIHTQNGMLYMQGGGSTLRFSNSH